VEEGEPVTHNGTRLGRIAAYAVLVIATVIALFPIYWTLLTSLRTRVSIFETPPRLFGGELTLDNYRTVFADGQFQASLTITVVVTVLATLIAVITGTFAAYAIARRPRFRTRRPFEAMMILVRAMPGIVIAVPLFQIVVGMGLYDQPIVLAITYAAINLPFAVWLMVGFISGIPVELEESARVDGASQFRILRSIILPLVAPGLAATTIFVALLCWNEFLMPLILADQAGKTLPVYIAGFVTSRTIDYGAMAAAASLAIIPIAIVTLLVQRQLVRGLSLGAVKD
jgi:ABC-type glycerol-3-phosphate transport system permease component